MRLILKCSRLCICTYFIYGNVLIIITCPLLFRFNIPFTIRKVMFATNISMNNITIESHEVFKYENMQV